MIEICSILFSKTLEYYESLVDIAPNSLLFKNECKNKNLYITDKQMKNDWKMIIY